MRTLIALCAIACGGCASLPETQQSSYTLYADIQALIGAGVTERVYIATFDVGPAESTRLGDVFASQADYNRHFCEQFAEMAMQQNDAPGRAWCEPGPYRRMSQ